MPERETLKRAERDRELGHGAKPKGRHSRAARAR